MSSPTEARPMNFRFRVVPSPASPHFGKVGGAHVYVWAMAVSLDQGRARAISWLMDQGWMEPELQSELDTLGAPRLHLRTDEEAVLHRARREGVWAFFAGWPVEPSDDPTVQIERVQAPVWPSAPKQ